MKIENRQKFLLILTLVAIGLYVGDLVVFEPLKGWWKMRSQNIITLRKQVAHGKSMLLNEAGLRGQWEGMFTNTLANDKSLAEHQVLNALDNWAQQSGAGLTGVSSQWKNDGTNYTTLNCNVTASGNIATLGQFLYRIEKGPLALKLDSVEFSTHDNTGQQLNLGMQISGLALNSSPTK